MVFPYRFIPLLSNLPRELLQEIFSFILDSAAQLRSIQLVCRRFHGALEDSAFWQRTCFDLVDTWTSGDEEEKRKMITEKFSVLRPGMTPVSPRSQFLERQFFKSWIHNKSHHEQHIAISPVAPSRRSTLRTQPRNDHRHDNATPTTNFAAAAAAAGTAPFNTLKIGKTSFSYPRMAVFYTWEITPRPGAANHMFHVIEVYEFTATTTTSSSLTSVTPTTEPPKRGIQRIARISVNPADILGEVRIRGDPREISLQCSGLALSDSDDDLAVSFFHTNCIFVYSLRSPRQPPNRFTPLTDNEFLNNLDDIVDLFVHRGILYANYYVSFCVWDMKNCDVIYDGDLPVGEIEIETGPLLDEIDTETWTDINSRSRFSRHLNRLYLADPEIFTVMEFDARRAIQKLHSSSSSSSGDGDGGDGDRSKRDPVWRLHVVSSDDIRQLDLHRGIVKTETSDGFCFVINERMQQQQQQQSNNTTTTTTTTMTTPGEAQDIESFIISVFKLTDERDEHAHNCILSNTDPSLPYTLINGPEINHEFRKMRFMGQITIDKMLSIECVPRIRVLHGGRVPLLFVQLENRVKVFAVECDPTTTTTTATATTTKQMPMIHDFCIEHPEVQKIVGVTFTGVMAMLDHSKEIVWFRSDHADNDSSNNTSEHSDTWFYEEEETEEEEEEDEAVSPAPMHAIEFIHHELIDEEEVQSRKSVNSMAYEA